MKIENLSDELLQDLDSATDDALGDAVAWAEAHAFDVHLHSVGDVHEGRVRWTLVAVAARGDETARWWEFSIGSRFHASMRMLLFVELLGQLGEQRRRRTRGRPSNAPVAAGTA